MRFLDLRGAKAALVFVFLLATTGPVVAAEAEPWTDQFLREFQEIKTRLTKIETERKEILVKQAEMLKQLQVLRVQLHRKSRKPGPGA